MAQKDLVSYATQALLDAGTARPSSLSFYNQASRLDLGAWHESARAKAADARHVEMMRPIPSLTTQRGEGSRPRGMTNSSTQSSSGTISPSYNRPSFEIRQGGERDHLTSGEWDRGRLEIHGRLSPSSTYSSPPLAHRYLPPPPNMPISPRAHPYRQLYNSTSLPSLHRPEGSPRSNALSAGDRSRSFSIAAGQAFFQPPSPPILFPYARSGSDPSSETRSYGGASMQLMEGIETMSFDREVERRSESTEGRVGVGISRWPTSAPIDGSFRGPGGRFIL